VSTDGYDLPAFETITCLDNQITDAAHSTNHQEEEKSSCCHQDINDYILWLDHDGCAPSMTVSRIAWRMGA